MPVNKLETISNGRRFICVNIIGLRQTLRKLTKPIPRLAHFASEALKPADSNIFTE